MVLANPTCIVSSYQHRSFAVVHAAEQVGVAYAQRRPPWRPSTSHNTSVSSYDNRDIQTPDPTNTPFKVHRPPWYPSVSHNTSI